MSIPDGLPGTRLGCHAVAATGLALHVIEPFRPEHSALLRAPRTEELTPSGTAGLSVMGPIGSANSLARCCKLDQEPVSNTEAQRATLETLRAFDRHEYRPWPSLPASDSFAVPSGASDDVDIHVGEAAAPFVFGILVPGYVVEVVEVNLVAPVEVPDALAILSSARNQVQAHLFPVLTPVQPMPSPSYGLVIALPGWAQTDTALCLDLQEIDGRLYVDLGPTAADRTTLLQFAGLPSDAQVDIYLGAESVPMPDQGVFDMHHGMCIFYTPRHALPGAYFYLADVLLSSYAWDEDAYIPTGPQAPIMCLVTEKGARALCFDDEETFGATEVIARVLGLPEDQLHLQPAVPPVADAAISGRPCRGVYGASGLVPQDAEAPDQDLVVPVIGMLDCRAMLQGWDLVATTAGHFPLSAVHEALDTFTPPYWELYLERAFGQADLLQYAPGSVIFASYVPKRSAGAFPVLNITSEGGDSDSQAEDPDNARDLPPAEPDVSFDLLRHHGVGLIRLLPLPPPHSLTAQVTMSSRLCLSYLHRNLFRRL